MVDVRRIVCWMILPLTLSATAPVNAQTTVVENADGSVSVTIDGEVTPISSDLAAEIASVLEVNAGDVLGLRTAVRELVTEHAGNDGDDSVALARAIAVFAVHRSSGSPEIVTAIVFGTALGNPTVTVVALLDVLPAVTAAAQDPEPAPLPLSTQATAENPSQVSPPE